MALSVKGESGCIQPLYHGNRPFLTDKREHVALIETQGSFKAVTLFAGQVIRNQLNIQTPNTTLSRVLTAIRSGKSMYACVREGDLFFVPGGLPGGNELMKFIGGLADCIEIKETVEKMLSVEKEDWEVDFVHQLYLLLKPQARYADFVEALGKVAEEDIQQFAQELSRKSAPMRRLVEIKKYKEELRVLRNKLRLNKEALSKKEREIDAAIRYDAQTIETGKKLIPMFRDKIERESQAIKVFQSRIAEIDHNRPFIEEALREGKKVSNPSSELRTKIAQFQTRLDKERREKTRYSTEIQKLQPSLSKARNNLAEVTSHNKELEEKNSELKRELSEFRRKKLREQNHINIQIKDTESKIATLSSF